VLEYATRSEQGSTGSRSRRPKTIVARRWCVFYVSRPRAAAPRYIVLLVRLGTTNEQSIGSAIDDILLLAEYMPEEEIKNQIVVFLPFRG
jgi:hypothetical protein